MTSAESAFLFRDFTAPRCHGEALIDPPLGQLPSTLAANVERARSHDISFAGVEIHSLRKTARQEVLHAASHYSARYRDIQPYAKQQGIDQPILMAGHQPELFHPGVWFKNYILSSLGQRVKATAINLIVDNDLCGAAAVRIPSWSQGQLTRVSLPFDGPTPEAIPFEQRSIMDRHGFAEFPVAVREALQGLIAEPCVDRLWRHARQAARYNTNLGGVLAQARHTLEAELGWQTLELPLSSVCQSHSFAAFVLAICLDPSRWQACYNQSLLMFRKIHGIRSHAHPVPSLEYDDGWYEMPLWLYGDNDPRRRPVWVRRVGRSLEISDRQYRRICLEYAEDGVKAIEQLVDQFSSQVKLRPRALLTTMYARLILSDLFLHGIGGAKYDQLGDLICRQFFSTQPLSYGVLSATVLLPSIPQLSLPESSKNLEVRLRQARFAPETFSEITLECQPLIAEKRQLLINVPPRGARKAWHRRLEELNLQMGERLEKVVEGIKAQIDQARAVERQWQVLQSREHPIIAFPLQRIMETFHSLG
jgi:hypothetical protein